MVLEHPHQQGLQEHPGRKLAYQQGHNEGHGTAKQDRFKPTEGMRLLQDFERGLKDQTYLSFE